MSGNGLAVVDSAALNTIRDQLAPGASDAELQWFGQVAQRLDLDPFRGQIVLIPRWDNRVKRNVYRPQVTVDGRRALATRTGQLTGIEGPWWTGPRNERGELNWQELWDNDNEPPYAARVFVYRFGWVKPANGTAKWSEFAQWVRPKDGDPFLVPTWAAMPAHMLGKVAESMALRRAFPEVISEAVAVEYDAIDSDGTELVATAAHQAPAQIVGGGTPEPERKPELAQQHVPPVQPPADEPPAERTNPDEFIVPTREQADETKRLLEEAGLAGRENKTARDAYISNVAGRPITNLNDLTRNENALLIDALRATVYALQPEEEPF
jgi:phage recombination protein Bet